MSSDDFQPNESNDKAEEKNHTDPKPKWVMTQQAWDKLLCAFSADQEEAAQQYERVRLRLFRLFEWNGVGPVEDLADETFNRVARRIDEGQKIDNLVGYILGVGRMICKEEIKKPAFDPLDETTEGEHRRDPEPGPEIEPDARLECFDKCIAALAIERRTLILAYYDYEVGDKIKWRQKLADERHIAPNALRIRAHRIRMTLETCITRCLESHSVRNE